MTNHEETNLKNTHAERRRQAARPAAFRLHPIAAACSSLLIFTGASYAQETPADVKAKEEAKVKEDAQRKAAAKGAEQMDTVVVTGIRHSIQSSVAAKRDSESIVEAISAEDIGKLPDLSIAESLARLPGLAGQRVGGRAQVIAIRGLSPDFAATLLNGREQVSTGDNRGVEFDQYPAELINRAAVYKTPDATLIGQGLSGTVALETVRPLDFRERKLSFNVRGESNSLSKLNANADTKGLRASVAYIDQFANNTIGLALGYAHLDSPSQTQHYKAWWWANTTPWGAPANGKPADATALMGAEAEAISKEQVRDGFMGVLEFKPSNRLHSTVDLYYSEFDQKETMRGMMWDSSPWNGGDPHWLNPVTTMVGHNSLLTGGTVTGLRPVVRNDYNTRKDELFALGWNTKFRFDDTWTATGDIAYSSAKRDERVLETYAGAATRDSFGFHVPGSPGFATFSPGLNYADASTIMLSDPGGWGHDGRLETPHVKDTLKSARLQIGRGFDGVFNHLDTGLAYSEREKLKTSSVFFANLKNGRAPVAVAPDLLVSSTSLGFAGIPGMLSYNVLPTVARYYDLTRDMSTDDWRKNFSITEKITTAFGKLGFEQPLGSATVHGNLGVQLVHTNQSSQAVEIAGAGGKVVSNPNNTGTYNDFLPSLNLISDFNNGFLIRAGLAKTLARGRVDDMRGVASAGVSTNSHLWSGDGGNPKLEPWRAKSYDVSFEKYFGKASYVAFAVFYKELDTYIYKQTLPYDFTGWVNTSDVQPISNIGTMSSPANGHGGYLHGAELSVAAEGNLLTPMLDGFGALFSLSSTDSSIKPDGPGTGKNMTLPGLSRTVANTTLYYEKNGFQARIAHRYRSDFRGEITTNFAQRSFTRVLDDRQTDMQIGYEFQSGGFKGLSVLFQVNNLTDSPYRTVQDGNFDGGAVAPQEYKKFGRQYLLGVTYKL